MENGDSSLFIIRYGLWAEVENPDYESPDDENQDDDSIPDGNKRHQYYRFSLSQFQMTYGINEVPSGAATIPIGIDLNDSGVRGALNWDSDNNVPWLEQQLKKAGTTLRVKFYIRFFRSFSENETDDYYPEDTACIFSGYIASHNKAMYGTTQEQAPQFVINVIHWLIDLDITPMMTANSSPLNDSNATYSLFINQMRRGDPLSAGYGPDDKTIGWLFPTGTLQPAAIQKDFWGEVLYPLLNQIASRAKQDLRAFLPCGLVSKDQPSDAAEDPLNSETLPELGRFEVYGQTGGSDRPPTPWCRPLSLEIPADADRSRDDGAALAAAIQRYVSRQTIGAFGMNTLWGCLQQLGGAFMFAVVPGVETALIAPFYFGSRKLYPVKLDGIFIANPTTTMIRPVRAVLVTPPGPISTVGMPLSYQADDFRGPRPMQGGCFVPGDGKTGAIRVIRAPKWMEGIPYVACLCPPTAASLGSNATIREPESHEADAETAENTDENTGENTDEKPTETENEPTPGVEQPKQKIAEAVKLQQRLYDRLAQYYYLNENFRGRYVTLKSRLRFDIGPGSTVAFQVAQKTGNTSQYARYDDTQELVGQVIKLTVDFSAQNSTASTTFQLGYVRTLEQNQSDAYSAERHPFYTGEPFTGAPLSKDFVLETGNHND